MKTLKAKTLRRVLNLWPPFWGSGIRVIEIADDWSSAKVRLRKRWYNRNYVNTHYGGSLFSMTDPFYMLLFLHKMGRDYVVWDKKAEIKFIKPGRKDVFAEFKVTKQHVEEFKQQLATLDKIEPVFEVDIVDTDGLLIAKVWKTIHISKKQKAAS
jgi:acyl-coenzyme A thioesterase PaaI-like protein